MNALLLFGVTLFSFLAVRAQEVPVLKGTQPSEVIAVQTIARQVRPGQIIVMGENHGLKASRQSQLALMAALRDAGLKVSAGLEFFYYPSQDKVDQYREGHLTEADFLAQIQWGQPAFEFYRDQALFPRLDEGAKTLALNAPRALTGKIAKTGLESLTEAEQAWLPPQFELGRASYKKRFLALMPHLPNPAAGERYFAAQSTWDDTMAWKAAEFMAAHPEQVLVIVVGDFHAQYADGLPARIHARTGQKPWVFSFVNAAGLSEAELQAELLPSAEYGPRGDFIWLANEVLPE